MTVKPVTRAGKIVPGLYDIYIRVSADDKDRIRKRVKCASEKECHEKPDNSSSNFRVCDGCCHLCGSIVLDIQPIGDSARPPHNSKPHILVAAINGLNGRIKWK